MTPAAPEPRPVTRQASSSTDAPEGVTKVAGYRFVDGVGASVLEEVAVEAPLTIRVGGETLTVTMRTPGHDRELAIGFLVAEGWVSRASQVVGVAHASPEPGLDADGIVEVTLDGPPSAAPSPSARRGTLTTSACGVCGRSAIDDLMERCTPVEDRSPWDIGVVHGLTALLAERQPVFSRTGGLHAAAVVRREDLDVVAFEDVGRHNAVDKVVGAALLAGRLPLGGHALVVSGRTSFEIVQKAVAAGIPVVVGVSAPSSLAIEVARRAAVTLVGFARGAQLTAYCGEARLR